MFYYEYAGQPHPFAVKFAAFSASRHSSSRVPTVRHSPSRVPTVSHSPSRGTTLGHNPSHDSTACAKPGLRKRAMPAIRAREGGAEEETPLPTMSQAFKLDSSSAAAALGTSAGASSL